MHLLIALLLALLFSPASSPPKSPTRKAATTPAASSAGLLRKFNLVPLWLVSARPAEAQTMLGCMGPQYRPFDLVFEKVRRDAKNPALYHVQGKSRERERLLPFRGTIMLSAIQKARAPYPLASFKAAAHYQAAGTFRLVEDPAEEGAGVFSGKVVITFSQTPTGLAYQPSTPYWWNENSTGEGSTFTSRWTSKTHPAAIQLVWATNFMNIAHHVMEQFNLWERGPEINPKYARVGWSSYWQNDEWWADAPEPAL
ncbi:hypothetical protein E5K00_02445 [Hymenobacter aquaticus]|uniref:Uncharacterized protein n=1 Tax=Hymenobacter aquaticus TaxID=1867101 RepID=A0A4Z0Q3C7_9BACT|nr:hypothetical protein [Hymenobacter aquaticus]TGE24094.1 hypothetical protein E5K00_02445 [Hymenobacter aquaticus]